MGWQSKVEVEILGIQAVVHVAILEGEGHVKVAHLGHQQADDPGEQSPGVDRSGKTFPGAGGVRTSCGIPEADPVIDEVGVVQKINRVILEEAGFLADAIVDGGEEQ
jgi:hypothetical protein